MDVGQPPIDPFAGMSSAERKRAQERAILEMVYDTGKYRVTPRERPDFVLQHVASATQFGVEVTQLFPSEAQARLHLVPGYVHHLWSGGSHIHKDDVTALRTGRANISDEDGTILHTDVPVILGPGMTTADFRQGLSRVIRGKGDLSYDLEGLSHCNLVVLDWFGLRLDAHEYGTDRFFDDEVRESLQQSPFREVFLIADGSSDHAFDHEADNPYRIVPLQQLLAMERMYVTGSTIELEANDESDGIASLNELTLDHVTRVQGFGDAVMCEGRPFLRYQDILLEFSDRGMQVRGPGEYPLPTLPQVESCARLTPSSEARVSLQVREKILRCPYSLQANRPVDWGSEAPGQ